MNAEQRVAQVVQLLDRAFAVGAVVADDDATAVVLNGAGEDLARTGAELVDHHDQRALPDEARSSGWLVGLRAAVGSLYLDDRTVVDEQAGHVDGFGERAAAVPAQVDHDRVDVLGLELFEQPADVAGGALVVGQTEAGAVHVHVEAGQLNDADAIRRAVGLLALLE